MGKTQRLDKVLSNSGYGTRREIKKLVKQGVVTVNSKTVKDPGLHIDPYNDTVEVGGESLNYRENIYVMMNKPDGVVSATYDRELKTVVDILPEEYHPFDLFPVGRLDRDTEGLLLLTNDGKLAHKLTSPKNHVPKKYYALIEGEVNSEDVYRFKQGVTLDDGYKTMPAELEILHSGENSEVKLVIYEGKFHQVKRMFEAVGKKVKYLKRIEIAGLKLDDNLNRGQCRELSEEELEILKSVVK